MRATCVAGGLKDTDPNQLPMTLGGPAFAPPIAKPELEEPPSYTGHRERLRERFLKGGADPMPDYELLELLLFRAIPRRDVKPLAKDLLKQFGSFGGVIGAPIDRLAAHGGLGEAAITELKIVGAVALRLMQGEIKKRPVMATWTEVIGYCRAAMAFETREQFRILFLDKRNCIIADEVQQRGTVDHTPVYVREIVKRALELSSSAIILVHNHPSGDPTPSRADIDMTKTIVSAARPLGILVHDHLIIGKDGHTSFKSRGLI